MTVKIRQLEDSPGEYLAYSKSACGKATYFAYLRDDIFGAVVLVNFVEMLRSQFAARTVEVRVLESCIRPKDPALLELLQGVNDRGGFAGA